MHPFAKYIQILGKGRNGMRALTADEAYDAMHMITLYDVEPEQLGAFLMLMRVKEETADEVAGFTRALREALPAGARDYTPAIDWPAYAGKKRQLPWFLLAALVLARQGHAVFMHGLTRDDERIYVPQALGALGLPLAETLDEAEAQMRATGFSYMNIPKLSLLTSDLINTRELFGLRPPLHTVARMLNPFQAPLSLIGVFHPNYAEIHQQAWQLLGQPKALVAKGEGGEFERVPDRGLQLYGLSDGQVWQETWEAQIKPGKQVKPETLDLNHYRAVWLGEKDDHYGELAVIGTLALALRRLGLAPDAAEAHELASRWWRERHQNSKAMQEAV